MSENQKQVRFEDLPLGEQPGPSCGPISPSLGTSSPHILSRRAIFQSDRG